MNYSYFVFICKQMPKPCKETQVRNPSTGRCIKIGGRVYNSIHKPKRKPRSKSASRALKACKADQVRNPRTNRCINIGGEVHKKLKREGLFKSPPPPKHKSPCPPFEAWSPYIKMCVKTELTNRFPYEDVKARIGKLYLNGPVSVYEFKSKPGSGMNKHIYLFGDVHAKLGGCSNMKLLPSDYVNFPQFINDAIKDNPHKVVDFFEELAYMWKFEEKHGIQARSNLLPSYILNSFYLDDCYVPVSGKDKCRYPNVRYHKSDIRSLFQLARRDTAMSNRLHNLCAYLLRGTPFEKAYSTKELQAYSIQDPAFLKRLYDEVGLTLIDEATKSAKQLRNVPEKLRNSILDFLRQAMVTHRQTLEKFPMDMQDFCRKLTSITSFTMDSYMLGRVFRKFQDGTEPENIIIAAGNAHVRRYRDFLKQSGLFDTVFEAAVPDYKLTPEFQCIDITGLKLPLFSN